MTKLIVELPTKDTPGFLKRSKAALSFKTRLNSSVIDDKVFDDMIEFLLPLVKEPTDRNEARDALWEASQEQFENILASLTGQVNPTPAESLTPSPDSTLPAQALRPIGF